MAVGNPVSAGSGNKHHRETLYIGSSGLDYTLTYVSRLPASQYQPASAHGVFWTSDYQSAVMVTAGEGSSVSVQRANGQLLQFSRQGDSNTYLPDMDINQHLTRLVDTSNGGVTGWKLQNGPDGELETFDSSGKLVNLTDRGGRNRTLGYDSQGRLGSVTDDQGHRLQFTYNAQSLTYRLILPDGGIVQFAYDAANNLSSVRYPDEKSKTFHYEDSRFPNHLSGITDEDNVRYATWTYDGQGRAISSEHAGSVERHELTYNAGNTVVKDPLGTSRTKQLTTVLGVVKSAGESQPGGSGCGPASSAITYDANGNVSTRTDFNGNTTTATYDLSRNLETQRIEASGKPEQRTISTAWHTYWRLPIKVSEPKKLTTWIYNGDGGVYCAPQTATVPSINGGTQPIGVVCSQTEQATTDR